ncbi:MAG: cytochrome C oxidase subunit IV family protein [Phycisphaerales bacterium]
MADTQHTTHQVGHVVPIRILFGVAMALLVLTAVTVYTAQYVDLGRFNIWLALIIATVKASLVCLYFMHLRWDSKFNGIVLLSSIVLVFLFIGLALTDTDEYQPQIRRFNETSTLELTPRQ